MKKQIIKIGKWALFIAIVVGGVHLMVTDVQKTTYNKPQATADEIKAEKVTTLQQMRVKAVNEILESPEFQKDALTEAERRYYTMMRDEADAKLLELNEKEGFTETAKQGN